MTRAWGVEFAKGFGIRVNGIAPGPIESTEGMNRLAGGLDLQSLASEIPVNMKSVCFRVQLIYSLQSLYQLARMGTGQDIASAALFLVSDLSSWTTGQTIVVDGGSFLFKKHYLDEAQYDIYRQSLNNAKL